MNLFLPMSVFVMICQHGGRGKVMITFKALVNSVLLVCVAAFIYACFSCNLKEKQSLSVKLYHWHTYFQHHIAK